MTCLALFVKFNDFLHEEWGILLENWNFMGCSFDVLIEILKKYLNLTEISLFIEISGSQVDTIC